MSENIQSISQGTYTIGQTSATNFVAGPGIKIDEPSAGTVRIGNDETVLYESTGASANINLSEPLSGFEKIEMRYYPQELTNSNTVIEYFPGAATNFGLAKWVYHGGNANYPYVLYCTRYILSGNSLTFNKADHTWFNTSFAKAGNGNNPLMISKIVGINRKEV